MRNSRSIRCSCPRALSFWITFNSDMWARYTSVNECAVNSCAIRLPVLHSWIAARIWNTNIRTASCTGVWHTAGAANATTAGVSLSPSLKYSGNSSLIGWRVSSNRRCLITSVIAGCSKGLWPIGWFCSRSQLRNLIWSIHTFGVRRKIYLFSLRRSTTFSAQPGPSLRS